VSREYIRLREAGRSDPTVGMLTNSPRPSASGDEGARVGGNEEEEEEDGSKEV